MKEERARELAFSIIGEFEELLGEHDIFIPSNDREGEPEEACIYGSEYYQLEDAITDILMKGSSRSGKTAQARDMAFRIIEEFEELLNCHRIKVPSVDARQRASSEVALCMPEWDRLRDGIVQLLLRNTVAWRLGRGDQRGQRLPAGGREDQASGAESGCQLVRGDGQTVQTSSVASI